MAWSRLAEVHLKSLSDHFSRWSQYDLRIVCHHMLCVEPIASMPNLEKTCTFSDCLRCIPTGVTHVPANAEDKHYGKKASFETDTR